MKKIIHALKKFSFLLQKISSVFLIFSQNKNRPSGTAFEQDEKTLQIELKGQLLELYVKPVVNELHRKTPKGLKYLKEACSK